jgi:L-threonylcarbamoyladenylate synthase
MPRYTPSYILAARAMCSGGVIAYPTEGVWGLGCDPLDGRAVSKILALKSRPEHKGLILLAPSIDFFGPYFAELDSKKLKIIEESRGKGITWLISNSGSAPEWITGGQSTLAIRVSDHPRVVGICEAFGGAIVSTSANPAGLRAATNLLTVQRYFGNLIDAIVPGATGGQNGATEIRDLQSGRTIRPKKQVQ